MVRRHIAILITAVSLVTACGSSTPAAPGSTGPSTSPTTSVAPPKAPPSPSSTAVSSSPAASSGAARVVALLVTADPDAPIGACPVEITFSGRISVAGAGTVSYQWISSDSDTSPAKTLTFASAGSMDVTSSWTVDPDALPTHAGWSAIEILDPASSGVNSAASARAAFAFTCDTDDDIESIGFGIGGSDADCSIARNTRTFGTTDPVRMVAHWRPSLASGTVVTIRLERDGVLVDGYPVTTNLHESTKCIHGSVSRGFLAVGHYRLDVMPDTARAIGGEFDVK